VHAVNCRNFVDATVIARQLSKEELAATSLVDMSHSFDSVFEAVDKLVGSRPSQGVMPSSSCPCRDIQGGNKTSVEARQVAQAEDQLESTEE
jgi:hypothetical protein